MSIPAIIMRRYFVEKKRKTRETRVWKTVAYLSLVRFADCSKVDENRVLGGEPGTR